MLIWDLTFLKSTKKVVGLRHDTQMFVNRKQWIMGNNWSDMLKTISQMRIPLKKINQQRLGQEMLSVVFQKNYWTTKINL